MPVSPESEIGVAYGQGRASADLLAQPTTNPYSDATLLGKQQRASWFQGYYDAIRDQNIRLLQAGLAFLNVNGVVDASIAVGVNGGSISQQSAGSPDQSGLWTGSVSNAWLIAEEGDKAFDFAHPAQVDPTLFVHSHNQNVAQWLSLRHGGTNGEVLTGSGALSLQPSSGQVFFPTGTAAVPSVSFAAATNAGWFIDANGQMGLASSGVHAMSIGTAIRQRSDGTINWSNTTGPLSPLDTGMARNAAGVIRASAGGAEIRGFMGGGAAVASAAALPLPTGRVFHVTGVVNITSITSTNFQAGVVITLIFDGVLTLTDGGNLKLAGNFVTSVDATISLVYDGTNWFELGRSVN